MPEDFSTIVQAGVRSLTPYQPGKPVEELQRELGLTEVVKLASNENPLGPSPLALAEARRALSDIRLYPDGSGYRLKQALAQHLGVEIAAISLGNGSSDLLELVARAFLGPGTAAVYSAHAFAMYPIYTTATGAECRVAPAGLGHSHDLDAMAARIDTTVRVVFIANPNNPTGGYLATAALREFLQWLPRHVIVVVDEAYCEYVEQADYPDCMPWVAELRNLVVTRTFSKAYGLAGLRIGYAVSDPAVADYLNRIRQPFNVNSIALSAASAALTDQEHLRRSREVNAAGLQQLQAGVERLGLRYTPSVGNFLLVDLGRDAAPIYQALLAQGVIVRPLANYALPQHLRVSIGLPVENECFLQRLAQVLADV